MVDFGTFLIWYGLIRLVCDIMRILEKLDK